MIWAGIILLVIMGGYVLFTLWMIIGWMRVPVASSPKCDPKHRLSVIVPFRNELDHLPALVRCLRDQKLPTSHFEVLLVNDHSNDDFEHLLADLPEHFQLIHLPESKSGKKAAIETGVSSATGEYIVSLDADTIVGNEWLMAVAASLAKEESDMLILPVHFKRRNGLLTGLLELEFYSLIGVTAGAVGVGAPFLSNGANLVFRKSAFEAVGGYQSNRQYASGDDVFLLQSFQEKGYKQIRYVKDERLWGATEPPAGLRAFFRQRVRWGGKARGYRSMVAIFASWLVFLQAVALLASVCLLPFESKLATPIIVAFGAKCIIDFLLLFLVSSYFGRSRLLMYVVPLEIIYPIYIIAVALGSLSGSSSWKGRKVE